MNNKPHYDFISLELIILVRENTKEDMLLDNKKVPKADAMSLDAKGKLQKCLYNLMWILTQVTWLKKH